MAAAQQLCTDILSRETKQFLQRKMDLYLKTTTFDPSTQRKTLVFTSRVDAWKDGSTGSTSVVVIREPIFKVTQGDDAHKSHFIMALTHYLRQLASGQPVHPLVILWDDEAHIILTSDSRQALRVNPVKAHVRKQFRLQLAPNSPVSESSTSSSSDEEESSYSTETVDSHSDSNDESSFDMDIGSSSPTDRGDGPSTSAASMEVSGASYPPSAAIEESMDIDDASHSGEECSLPASSGNVHDASYLGSMGYGTFGNSDEIAEQFICRGVKNRDAVLIFTFTEAGEKWGPTQNCPAIVIPSKLFLPSPMIRHSLRSTEYHHNEVEMMMVSVAEKVELVEGRAPFISYVNFGAYGVGYEVDFVLSRNVHEVPLYLHTCILLPAEQRFVPPVSIPARYHHHSCRGRWSSFQTRVYLGCIKSDDITAMLEDSLLQNKVDLRVAHSPLTDSQDTVEIIASRLGESLKRNLDAKLKLFLEPRDGDAQLQPVIFTDDANLWTTDRNPVIITSEPFPPIPLRGYDYRYRDIAEDMCIYLIKTARLETGTDVDVTYVRFKKRYVSDEAHLIFTRSSLVTTDRDFVRGVWNLGRPLPPQAEPVHCLLGRSLPSQIEPQHYLMAVTPPWIFINETVLWVEPRTPSTDMSYDFQRVYLEWPVFSETIVSRLDETLRANLNSKLKLFIEWRHERREPVTVIFTTDAVWWRGGKNVLIKLEASWRHAEEEELDTVCEITDYLRELAERAKIGPLNVSCLRLERTEGMDLHLVLSQCDEPASFHLENCTFQAEPDVEDTITIQQEVAEGVYRYNAPTSEYLSPKIHMRVIRKFRDMAGQAAGALAPSSST